MGRRPRRRVSPPQDGATPPCSLSLCPFPCHIGSLQWNPAGEWQRSSIRFEPRVRLLVTGNECVVSDSALKELELHAIGIAKLEVLHAPGNVSISGTRSPVAVTLCR